MGSQTETPDAYVAALGEVGRLIVKAGIVLDRLDVGGGFPSVYSGKVPAQLSAYIRAIADGVERLPVGDNNRCGAQAWRKLLGP